MSETTYMFEQMPFIGNDDAFAIPAKCKFAGCKTFFTNSVSVPESDWEVFCSDHNIPGCLKNPQQCDGRGCLDYWDCSRAASRGHLECLKFAHARGEKQRGTTTAAAQAGQLECLKYAHKNGFPWGDNPTAEGWDDEGQPITIKGVGTTASAASRGQFECLKYAHENGCPWDENTTAEACRNGHLDCLKYAHESGCPWDEHATLFAAASGHLDCLKYALIHGCPMSNTVRNVVREKVLIKITVATDLTEEVDLRVILQHLVFQGHLGFLDRVKVDQAFKRYHEKIQQISEILHGKTRLPSAVITHEILSFL